MARKATRRSRQPVPVEEARRPVAQRTARPAAQRSTFRVAQARRALADSLPGVIYSKPERRQRAVDPAPPLSRRAPQVAPQAARKDSRPPVRAQALTMKRDDHLKCRPKHSDRRKAGSGAGRAFVPWSKTC